MPLRLLNCVKVLTEAVDLLRHVLAAEVEHELDWQVLEHVSLGLLTVLQHVRKQHILRREVIVPLEVIHELFLPMDAQLVKIAKP